MATPRENNDAAVRFFHAAWDEGDFETLDAMTLPDAVDHSRVGGKEKSEKGSGSFKQIVGMFRSAMPDVKLDIQDEIYTDDMVIHRWVLKGTQTGQLMGIPPTNKAVELGGITIVRMKDGKVAERWAQVDELGLLQQLGVVPPPPGGDGH